MKKSPACRPTWQANLALCKSICTLIGSSRVYKSFGWHDEALKSANNCQNEFLLLLPPFRASFQFRFSVFHWKQLNRKQRHATGRAYKFKEARQEHLSNDWWIQKISNSNERSQSEASKANRAAKMADTNMQNRLIQILFFVCEVIWRRKLDWFDSWFKSSNLISLRCSSRCFLLSTVSEIICWKHRNLFAIKEAKQCFSFHRPLEAWSLKLEAPIWLTARLAKVGGRYAPLNHSMRAN